MIKCFVPSHFCDKNSDGGTLISRMLLETLLATIQSKKCLNIKKLMTRTPEGNH